jgi:hypothetical protein
MRNPAILAGLMVNEWLRRAKNPVSEPFPEQTVIQWPLSGRIWNAPWVRGDHRFQEPEILENDFG